MSSSVADGSAISIGSRSHDATVGNHASVGKDGSASKDATSENDGSANACKPLAEPTPLDDPRMPGPTWGSWDSATVANIPVCFLTVPHREWDGTVACCAQSPGTDCDGNAFSTGEEEGLRQQLRALIGDTWQRNARLNFSEFAECPISATTSIVESADLAGTLIVSFHRDGNTLATTGIGKRKIASDVHVNAAALSSGDHAGIREILREFGHVLGFPYEWVRFKGLQGGPCPSVMPPDPGVSFPNIPDGISDPASVMDRCAYVPDTPAFLSFGDVLGIHEVYGHKQSGALVGTNGQCVGSTSPGARVTGTSCDESVGNSWTRTVTSNAPHFVSDISSSNRCLAATRGPDAGSEGVTLVNDLCAATEQQRIATTGLQWRTIGNACLAASGDAIEVAVCDTNSDAQRWNFWQNDASSSVSWHQIQASDGRCVTTQTIPAAGWQSTAHGEELRLTSCNQADPRQIFSYFGKGFIGLGDPALCLNVFAGVPNPGAPVGLWSGCLDEQFDNMRFFVTGSFHVIGKCLSMDENGVVLAEPCAEATQNQIFDYHF